MKKEQISNRQLWFILFIIKTTMVIASPIILISTDVKQDAWIAASLALVGSLIILLIISLLDIKFPNMTIFEYSELLLGKVLGKILNLILLWNFLSFGAIELRIYGEVIVTAFLPQTPIFFVISLMVISVTFCIYKGVEVLARATDIFFFHFLMAMLGGIFIPLPYVELKNIQPILVRGWHPIIEGALISIALLSNGWILTMLSPLTTEPKKTIKTIITSKATAMGSLVILIFLTINVLGPFQASRSTFPMLSMMRAIELSEFIQRTEVVLTMAWGMGLFVSVATYFYYFNKGLSQMLKLTDYRSLTLPTGVILAFLAVHSFEDIFELLEFFKVNIFTPYGLGILLIPTIILWSAYGIKKLISQQEEHR